MNKEQFLAKINLFDNEDIYDEEVENKLHEDKYVNALLMLTPFLNNPRNSLNAAKDDLIFLNVNIDKLCESNPSDAFIKDMLRTGIFYESNYDCFSMVVC